MHNQPTFLPRGLPPLHELLAHSHLLTQQQRRLGVIGAAGPLLCVHSEATRDGETVVTDRFFAGNCSPAATLMALRAYQPERGHSLFVVDAPPSAERMSKPERQRAFVRAGFRLVEVQWLMICHLPTIPQPIRQADGISVHRASAAADAIVLSAIDGLEPIRTEELHDSALLHYYVAAANVPTAYGRSALYDETIAWVSHVHTAPQYRRRGHASALLARLLDDSAQSGVTHSLLLSTDTAHMLYKRFGYVDIQAVAILQAPPALLRRNYHRP